MSPSQRLRAVLVLLMAVGIASCDSGLTDVDPGTTASQAKGGQGGGRGKGGGGGGGGGGGANTPPTVSAGEDQVVASGSQVELVGSADDPDGRIVSTEWTQAAGSSVHLRRSNKLRTSFSAPVTSTEEVLVFTLTVTDDRGASASDDVAVTVTPPPAPNQAPTVSAGLDETVPLGSPVSLQGTASDPDGQVVTVSWVQLSGTPVQIQGADQLQAGFQAPGGADILIFILTAVDDDGASASSFVRITVGGDMVQAGFRYSTYGPAYDPGPQYWAEVGMEIASRFPGSRPQAIWIVGGALDEGGTLLTFPGSSSDPNIDFTASDNNEAALDLFDQIGLDVWLQVEPGYASVPELIHLILDRYGHHPSVMGVGVDAEWYRWKTYENGKPVSDAEASTWLAAAREHRPSYRLFLKHWLVEKMPPTVRDGITFIDDSQQFSNLDQMVREFEDWGRAFSAADVGFQYGYPADRTWWGGYADPMETIGDAILAAVPNARGVFWVDFTILDVFPP